MAGTTSGASRNPTDILFDLTPADDQQLQESDLLQLVNYGQLQKPVKVPGTDGKIYTIEMALLWDEDYIDILRRTTGYANDPLLRVKLMRRLKIHRAIQKIDDHVYGDKADVGAQRQLWNILTKLADKQMECLNMFYEQLELERNFTMMTAVKDLVNALDSTLPPDVRPKDKTSADTAAPNTTAPVDDHLQVFGEGQKKQEQTEELLKSVLGVNNSTPQVITSPVQNKG